MLLLTLHLFASFLLPQTTGKTGHSEDPRIGILYQRYLEENRRKPSVDGYRIQLYFGNEREKAREEKTKFLKHFPGISAYESYQQPNFRIRAGDFRTRLEAVKNLKEISANFPGAFVVTDQINLPEIKKP